MRTREEALCPARDILAAPLEATAWCLVVNTLLDIDNLRKGLSAARGEHDEANARRRERVQTLDVEIARLRTRLSRIVAQRLEADPGGEIDRALLAAGRETETQISRIEGDRQWLAEPVGVGLSEEAAIGIEQFAAEAAAGIDLATPDQRRRLFHMVDLRAAIRVDPEGSVKIGRKHRYSIDWSARIPLVNHDGILNDHVVACFRYDQCR
jgi:hypothetical protein